MDKNKIRTIFKNYRQQIVELNEQLENQYYYYQEEASSRANVASRRAEACRRECEEARRQEESDRWYREDQIRSATKDLERAGSYDDKFGKARAIEKLKKLC